MKTSTTNVNNVTINNTKKDSFRKRVAKYMREVVELAAPGYIVMNGGYYRPAK